MKTYQFESIVEDNGAIFLPQNMRRLKKHRVKLTVVDLEPISDSPLRILSEITRKYKAVNEKDLNIAGIYKQRAKPHDREIVFD